MTTEHEQIDQAEPTPDETANAAVETPASEPVTGDRS